MEYPKEGEIEYNVMKTQGHTGAGELKWRRELKTVFMCLIDNEEVKLVTN